MKVKKGSGEEQKKKKKRLNLDYCLIASHEI